MESKQTKKVDNNDDEDSRQWTNVDDDNYDGCVRRGLTTTTMRTVGSGGVDNDDDYNYAY